MTAVSTNASHPEIFDAPRGFNAHLMFFDRDDDQRISLRETHRGLERIGLGHVIALPATAMIHLGIAALSVVRGTWQNPMHLTLPDLGLLRHPDTALVDERAWFDQAQLDAAFSKYGKMYAGQALYLPEIAAMASARLRDETHGIVELLLLPAGAAGTLVEWGALLWLAGERRFGRRVLTKRAVERFYTDPKFFTDISQRLQKIRLRRANSPRGKFRNLVQSWLF